MKRKILVLILSILIVGCTGVNSKNEKQIKLASGKTITVNINQEKTSAGDNVLVVDFQNDEKVFKEETVENQVQEIWNKIENEVNQTEVTEGIIKATYFIGQDEKTNEPVFESFLFTIEKIENGTWQIKKVN